MPYPSPMLRVAASVIILLAAGIGYEEVTGNQIGVGAMLRSLALVITDTVSGTSSPAFGGMGGLGG